MYLSETNPISVRGEEKNNNELGPLELHEIYRCFRHNVDLVILSDTVEDAKGTVYTSNAFN